MGVSVSVAVKGLHPPAGRGNDSRNEEVKCTQRGKWVCMHVICAHTCLHVYPGYVYMRETDRGMEAECFQGILFPGSVTPKANFTFALFLLYYKSQEIT